MRNQTKTNKDEIKNRNQITAEATFSPFSQTSDKYRWLSNEPEKQRPRRIRWMIESSSVFASNTPLFFPSSLTLVIFQASLWYTQLIHIIHMIWYSVNNRQKPSTSWHQRAMRLYLHQLYVWKINEWHHYFKMCKSKLGPESGGSSLSLKDTKSPCQKARQFETSPKKSSLTPSLSLLFVVFSYFPLIYFSVVHQPRLHFNWGPCNFKELCQIFITGFICSVKSLLVSPQQGVMWPRQSRKKGEELGGRGGCQRERRVISEQLLGGCVWS